MARFSNINLQPLTGKSSSAPNPLLSIGGIPTPQPKQGASTQQLFEELQTLKKDEEEKKDIPTDIKVYRYDGVSYINKKDSKSGLRLTGETNQFFFQIDLLPEGEWLCLKARFRNMRNAQKMSLPETICLLPQLAEKERNSSYKKCLLNLTNAFQNVHKENEAERIRNEQRKQRQQQVYATEPVNMDLITSSFVGKTEIMEHPDRIVNTEERTLIFKGFLKGHIFYRFHCSEGLVAEKATDEAMTDAVPLSREEIQFILDEAREKHSESEFKPIYDEMAYYADKWWKLVAEKEEKQRQEAEQKRLEEERIQKEQERIRREQERTMTEQRRQEQIRIEFEQNPIFFLSYDELIEPFKNIDLVVYKEKSENDEERCHITFKYDGKIYHIAPDEDEPIFACIDGKPRPMKPHVFEFVYSELMKNEDHFDLLTSIAFTYGKHRDKLPKENVDWNALRNKDASKLAHALTLEDIRQKQTNGDYPQLTQDGFKQTIINRVNTTQTKFMDIVRQNVSVYVR